MKRFIEFARCYIQGVIDDQIGIRAAALAYFATFSIFPLALLFISAVGFFLDDPERQQQVFDAIDEILPEITYQVLAVAEETVENLVASRNISGLIAVIGLLWAASGFFRGLEFSVNVIFGTGTPRPIWESRGVGILMALLVIPVLFLAVALALAFSVSRNSKGRIPGIPPQFKPFLSAGINYAVSLALFIIIFFLIYRYIPRHRTPARPALVGAVLASVAMMILTYGFNWYFQSGFSKYNTLYGSIGTVIALIFYFYLTNYIVLLGAELSAQLGKTKDCFPAPLHPALEEYIDENLQ